MKRFNLPEIVTSFNRIHTVRDTCAKLPHDPPTTTNYTLFIEVAEYVAKACNTAGFDHASSKAFGIMQQLRMTPWTANPSIISGWFEGLENDITIEMFKHKFVQIESGAVQYVELAQRFGSSVVDAFPDAWEDITDAGNNLALGHGTSAVFHLMRIVEWGLRGFASELGLLRVTSNRKKKKTTPLAFAQWEHILNQLPVKIDAKVARIARGPKKQAAQEFYYSTLQDISSFKEAWRNHVNHTRATYTAIEAAGVLSHVERFMKVLAAHGIRYPKKREE